MSGHVSLTPRERDVLRLMGEDLSNAQIAERLVVSPETVKWYLKEIYSKLGVHSRDEALALLDAIDPFSIPAVLEAHHNLPAPVTSLVGRVHELTTLRALVRDPAVRLVTLLGTPGIGKTRLGIETAHRLLNEFPDGVFFVPLAPLNEPDPVPDVVLTALGLDPGGTTPALERLKVFLRRKRLLLVIDNFEHLLDAAPLVGELLAVAPELKVLATSREPLRVYGEREFSVPPLDPASEAVTLFEARAQAVRPDFKVNEHNAVTVTAICKRLDGLPLAIELAAARMKLYTPHALLGRLASRLNTLTGGARDLPARQQTLRAAIAWSYDLLAPDEQRMFARFSVFEGGASLEAFAEVCGYGLVLDPLDGLESLMSKSLIQQAAVADESGPRFTIYEALAEFGAEQLAASGEDETVRHTHARHYLTLAAAHAASIRTANERWSIRGFDADYDNIRSAWLFAAAQPSDDLIGIAAHGWARMHIQVGRVQDGAHLYDMALQPRRDADTLVTAFLLGGRAALAMQLRDIAAAAPLAQQAHDLAARHENASGMAGPMIPLSVLALDQGDLDTYERLTRAALEIARKHNITFLEDSLLLNTALLLFKNGDYAAYIREMDQLLQSARQRGIRSLEAWISHSVVGVFVLIGDLDRACEYCEAGLAAAQSIGLRKRAGNLASQRALLAFLQGDLALALQMGLQTLNADEYSGVPFAISETRAFLAAVYAQLGDRPNAAGFWASAMDEASNWVTRQTDDFLAAHAVMYAPFVALVQDRPEICAALCAWSRAHSATDDWAMQIIDRLLPELQDALTPEAYAAAWARGEAMDVETALALARELAEQPL